MTGPTDIQGVNGGDGFSIYNEVKKIVREDLRKEGYSREVIENGESLWDDYASSFGIKGRDPKVWAAAIEYAIARLEFKDGVTQAKIAAKYGISKASIGNKYKALCDDLELCAFDERYSTVRSPVQRNMEMLREMYGGDMDVRISLDGRILG